MEQKTELNTIPQGLTLSTKVGNNQSVCAFHTKSKWNNSFHISLDLDDATVGKMEIKINEASVEYGREIPKHLYICNMVNCSNYKHVGTALHEYAFRMSIALGAEGHIRFQAVRDSHIFHYNNGFLMEDSMLDSRFFNYYLDMAHEMIISPKSTKNLSSVNLYLPQQRIDENLKKYALLAADLSACSDTDEVLQQIKITEKINFEARKKSIAIQLIKGLNSGLFPPENPVNRINYFLREQTDAQKCQLTKKFILNGTKLLIDLLPLDRDEKQNKFDSILVGTIICIMAWQDKTFGKQAIFNEEYLYPQKTFEEISTHLKDGFLLCELIEIVAEEVLKNSMVFNGNIRPNAFSGLQAIPEFKNIFHKYQLTTDFAEECEGRPGLFSLNVC